MSLYVLLDRARAREGCGDPVAAAAEAARAGARRFCLRDKGSPRQDTLAMGRRLRDVLAPYPDAQLLAHTDPTVSDALGAWGLHLPDDPALWEAHRERRLCVSTHNLEGLRQAARLGVTMATVSPVYLTDSKPGYGPALGLETLGAWARAVPEVAVWALGGVTPQRARACVGAGAAGVVVMGGIMAARDPYEATRAYLEALQPLSHPSKSHTT